MYYIIIIHRVNINLPIHLQSLVNFELDRFMIFKTETLPKIYVHVSTSFTFIARGKLSCSVSSISRETAKFHESECVFLCPYSAVSAKDASVQRFGGEGKEGRRTKLRRS